MKKRLFCIGFGYTANALSRMLIRHGWSVAGTTSKAEKASQMATCGVTAHLWHDNAFDPSWLDATSAILISAPPTKEGCPAFAAAGEAIANNAKTLHWIGYLSTNGVYGDHQGKWVEEQSELRAGSTRAKRRIYAEKLWTNHAVAHALPLKIFRLPGIYGPGRSAIDSVRAGTAKRIYKPNQVFSRMHVDDIAAALKADIDQPFSFDLFNLADNEPAPPQDVIEYACKLLEREPPPLIPLEQAALSEMAKSFYADNKRVSNRRMKDALGIKLQYPTYREGLASILKNEQDRP
ncbi:SDR family oxidoreductase [Hyphococcus lacteus]|uniref:SDR family oxidoreductase n=1 Tax=Hyphococcus lacteus TaxID=3143536 RepID=A0ABV3Z529_9PROT